MDENDIYNYIKSYYSYKENQCIMHYYYIFEKNNFPNINILLSKINDNDLNLKKEKIITGKAVIPFNYKNRNGDIMTHLSKYIIITFYPNMI